MPDEANHCKMTIMNSYYVILRKSIIMKSSRWTHAATLCGILLLLNAPAQAVVLTADVLHGAASRYETGQGVAQDPLRAARLYCIAALQGDARAAHQLGLLHASGNIGEGADLPVAAGWFQYAAERGDPRSADMLSRADLSAPATDPACPVARGTPERETIETWVRLLAPEYGIDPRMVLALISVESNFNPNAVSPANAHGLMQLLPSTARRFSVQDIHDPVQNISGGLAYLRWLMEYYSGKVRLVLAAYNAGEHAVDRYEGIPPYDETKRYVLNILVKYRKYIHPVEPLPIVAAGYETVDVAGNKIVMLGTTTGNPE
jgi:soluble lytic murein transglycosylase-like protein